MDFITSRFGGRRIEVFQQQYRVYTGAYLNKSNTLDEGGKIILPASALDTLSRMHVVYPMLFRIENPDTHTYTHCGVLEFSGEEGCVYIPYWMSQYLLVQPGRLVSVSSATLPKATYIKIRPQSKAFLEISDPKAVLEMKLRNFSCLTKGETIIIEHIGKQFLIDIMEVASNAVSGPVDAVSIVETDMEVDFDRPVDMPPSPQPTSPQPQPFPAPILGSKSSNNAAAGTSGASKEPEKPEEPEAPKFVAFTGVGRRLDGKTVTSQAPAVAASSTASPTSANNSTANTKPAATKVVFRAQPPTNAAPSSSSSAAASSNSSSNISNSSATTAQVPTKTTPPPPKEESKPEFVPFSGKGRSLRG